MCWKDLVLLLFGWKNWLFNYYLCPSEIYDTQDVIHGIPPGFSGFGFFREIVRTKINKTQKNQVNIKGIKYFCSHKQVLILLPHNLRQIPFLTLLLPECATLMEWVGMCTPPGRYHYQTCIQ